jgi:energy-coupling factor transport system ATP-binding protein
VITFDNFSYTYPNATQPAVRNVSIQLRPSSFTLVVGKSGAGKSTFLRCINGLVPHFTGGHVEGRLRVFDLDPIAVGPQTMSQQVGFVLQDPEAQFVMDTVEDEIAFALENAALPRPDMRLRVEETLDLLDLEPLRNRKLETLSGGERQRVAIASVLALRPRLLILDEPTSQLDPKSAEDVLNALTRLNSDLGLTILLSEHRLERVLPFVDAIIELAQSDDAARDSNARIGSPREMLASLDWVPPVTALAKELRWHPLPVTVKEGRAFSVEWMRTQTTSEVDSRSKTISAQPLIELSQIEAAYDQQNVLKNVSLNVNAGEVVVVLGRNGSGKTTLLKCMVGLHKPKRGEIRIEGKNISHQTTSQICKHIGYLPQDPNVLLFSDTAYDELALTLRNHRESVSESRVLEMLTALGLSDKAKTYPRDLSSGERQRVAFGAIAITMPKALLLDEPTRGLDYAAKKTLVSMLRKWQTAGTAIVLVTHDVEFAAEIATQVVVLSHGEVISEGDPKNVLGTSPIFAPQIARLFPGAGWLTVKDVLTGQSN